MTKLSELKFTYLVAFLVVGLVVLVGVCVCVCVRARAHMPFFFCVCVLWALLPAIKA